LNEVKLETQMEKISATRSNQNKSGHLIYLTCQSSLLPLQAANS